MLLPENPKAEKKVSLSICQRTGCFYIECNISITNFSFQTLFLFLFQTEMVRNYLNFIKSKLNFICFKKFGQFWGILGTSRKKVIPHSPWNEKSKFPRPQNIEKVIPNFTHSLRKKINICTIHAPL